MNAAPSLLSNQLEQLKKVTTVVADTGDFGSLEAYQPQDATTNPTLILKAVQKERYAPLLQEAVAKARTSDKQGGDLPSRVMDQLLIRFGLEILKIVPGRVSTELDARLSFDTENTVRRAREIIALYQENGIGRERVLVKIASTWEGLQAARVLEAEGIHVNMTLMFSLAQAIEAAEAKATLISPFVGRILDFHKKQTGKDYAPHEDPGVASVKEIYTYYKKFGYRTEVMGASFRNLGEIQELAGCDLLTISPDLLEELAKATGPLERKLRPEEARTAAVERIAMDEPTFRWMMNEDAMATFCLSDGIRRFAKDTETLNGLIQQALAR